MIAKLHVEMLERRFVWARGLSLCAWVLATVANCFNTTASELVILPSQVQIHSGYPARIVILEKFENGDCVDQSNNRDLILRTDREDLLEQIGVSTFSAVNSGQTTLRASWRDMLADAEVNVKVSPSTDPSFPREVSAVLGRAGCNLGTCHGNLHGKGGFRLSLRGDDPLLDFETITRGQGGRRIDLFSPTESLLLRKPIGDVAHQGGVRFSAESAEYKILKRWIENQCQWTHGQGEPSSSADEVVGLTVYPKSVVLRKSCRKQQLVVVAQFADGTERDVTRWSKFEPSLPTGVRIDEQGVVHADGPMDVSISVAYLQGRTASRLTFLARDQLPTPAPALPQQAIDRFVDNQLVRMKIEPAAITDDNTFLRRIYVVTVGRLPSSEEARQFLLDQSITKRRDLVDRLLSQPEFAMLWALRWSDLLRNEQKVMSSKGAALWHQWMSEQFDADKPLTEIVAQMLTTIGSTYENPPASFHRTHRDPETAAETIGQVFLGARLQCARCHNHPFDRWKQDDYYGLAAYFSTVSRKQVDNAPKDKFDKHIISGDEIISLEAKSPEAWHPGRAENIGPKPLTEKRLLVTTAANADKGAEQNPLTALATWLTNDNRQFARNLANRTWYHLFGRGIVDPPDDFRDSNPPSNPELLEHLTDELIRSGYSLKQLSRLILLSETFARQPAEMENSHESLAGAPVFAGYPLRRMPAEILLDAICDVTGIPQQPDASGDGMPPIRNRVMSQPIVPTRAGFLTAFGKPGRLLACECERSADVSLGQSLLLANGIETREKLAQPGNRLDQILRATTSTSEIIEEMYLTALARFPRNDEMLAMKQYLESSNDRRAAMEDLTWALINSKEFGLIR